jgi:hypothetical protein
MQLGIVASAAHLEGFQIPTIGPQRHLHLLRTRLISVGLDLQDILARHRGLVFDKCLTLGGQGRQSPTAGMALDLGGIEPARFG